MDGFEAKLAALTEAVERDRNGNEVRDMLVSMYALTLSDDQTARIYALFAREPAVAPV